VNAGDPRPGDSPQRIGVLISGRGSNLAAILEARAAGRLPAPVVLVVSNVPDAPGLAHARAHGVPTVVVDHHAAASREEHDRALAGHLRQAGVSVVCLAGYLRLLSPAFIRAFAGRILNIHPSLLPSFPGLHAQRQALERGVRVTGCTVHLVDDGLDSGPILLQSPVAVEDGDDEERLAARILLAEHQLYPEALRLFCADRIEIAGRTVRVVPESVRK
jgi:phosphoribosylglycinamide formyltransferase-1